MSAESIEAAQEVEEHCQESQGCYRLQVGPPKRLPDAQQTEGEDGQPGPYIARSGNEENSPKRIPELYRGEKGVDEGTNPQK